MNGQSHIRNVYQNDVFYEPRGSQLSANFSHREPEHYYRKYTVYIVHVLLGER